MCSGPGEDLRCNTVAVIQPYLLLPGSLLIVFELLSCCWRLLAGREPSQTVADLIEKGWRETFSCLARL